MKNEFPISGPLEPSDTSVSEHIGALQEFITARIGADSNELRDGDCEIVSSLVREYFNGLGFKNKIFEGDIPIGTGEYLSHRINFIYEGGSVWIIDLTSKQLPWLRSADWVIERVENNPDEVWNFMNRVYPGWS